MSEVSEMAFNLFLAVSIAAITVLCTIWIVGLIDKIDEFRFNRQKRKAEEMHMFTTTDDYDDGR